MGSVLPASTATCRRNLHIASAEAGEERAADLEPQVSGEMHVSHSLRRMSIVHKAPAQKVG